MYTGTLKGTPYSAERETDVTWCVNGVWRRMHSASGVGLKLNISNFTWPLCADLRLAPGLHYNV